MSLVILTSPGCTYCDKAKRLLDEFHRSYIEIDVTQSKGIRTFMIALGLQTVPQVFDKHVRLGGYLELTQMYGEPLET